jgi:hypothetical protein
MWLHQFSSSLRKRPAVILLVVISLLTLFAVVGLAFVLYANAQAESSRIFRESVSVQTADVDAELLLAYFLGQLVYDRDDQTGIYSALRGHSLGRLLYGYNDGSPNNPAWNGTGRLHTGAGSFMNPYGLDDYFLVNYTYYPADGFLRDPERLGMRKSLTDPLGPFTGGFNAPYTYADLNNMFLAAIKADGTVLTPSFHRPWLFNDPGKTFDDPTNSNWISPQGKYLVLRPRPAENPGFPYPEDAGGDVKNLVGPGYLDPTTQEFYNNDSIWLDLDFPVMMAPDGSRFKPLFAPLIIDLDSRLNLNVAGNIRGQNQSHVSNQGWGPWEVNPAYVLSQGGNEWTNLVLGNGMQTGRYGPDRKPGKAGTAAASSMQPHFYAQVDFDGCDETNNYQPSSPIQLPTAPGPPFSSFPSFSAGYGNCSPAELIEHPLLFNFFRPVGDDRVFATSNMEAPLRYGDTGSPALTSDLFRLGPRNFSDPRIRNLVTTHSFDLDRPGIPPWVWDPSQQPYQLPAGGLFPAGNPIPFPDLSLRTTSSVPQGSDFRIPGYPPSNSAADWRGLYANFARVNLNRPLTSYPIIQGAPFNPNDSLTLIQFQQAQSDRQQLAQDIYVRLQKVTGAYDPFDHSALPVPEQLNALRWLAQLAVNIVDFVDPDDVMTPFNWGAVGSPDFTALYGNQWVFGTELPRLVINEAYAEYKVVTPGPPITYQVDVWAELHNPLNTDNAQADPNQGQAILQMQAGQPGSYPVYQFVVSKPNTPSNIRNPGNVLGDPDAIYQTAGGTPAVVSDFSANSTVPPSNGNYSGPSAGNQGFYLLGPKSLPQSGAPNPPLPALSLQRPEMSCQIRQGALLPLPTAPTLLLRRLACPYLPPQVDPTKPNYNPYVTIDYLENLPLYDSTTSPVALRSSYGRTQPFAAHSTQLKKQKPIPVLQNQPQHTFFRHNAIEAAPPPQPGANQTLAIPFDWLVHLDRALISPMELLQVSGFKPHELTQQFMYPGLPFGHRVAWFDEDLASLSQSPNPMPSHRLYRIFEFFETKDLAAGVTIGGRTPGKVNLNSIWDPEVFRAVCDPQPANVFTVDKVDQIFKRIIGLRSPAGTPGPSDRPFLSLASGYTLPGTDMQNPGGIGINDTFLRSTVAGGDGNTQRLFQVPGAHPYLQDQLMTKVFNNLTTRSNVFAVWVTVGFFQVTDDAVRPVKLGAEIGRVENRHIRHRMFAIVDRSTLTMNPAPMPTFDPRSDPNLVPYFSIIK